MLTLALASAAHHDSERLFGPFPGGYAAGRSLPIFRLLKRPQMRSDPRPRRASGGRFTFRPWQGRTRPQPSSGRRRQRPTRGSEREHRVPMARDPRHHEASERARARAPIRARPSADELRYVTMASENSRCRRVSLIHSGPRHTTYDRTGTDIGLPGKVDGWAKRAPRPARRPDRSAPLNPTETTR